MIDNSKRESVDIELDKLNPEESRLNAEVLELKAKITMLNESINDHSPGTIQDKEILSRSNIDLAQKETQLSEIRKKITNVKSALNKPSQYQKDL